MNKHKCPVCGQYEFEQIGSFDICEVCGWTDDTYQEKFPDEDHFGNIMSLNEAKKAWTEGREVE